MPEKTAWLPQVILVGTYRKDQLQKWILPKGLYNYPIHDEDAVIRAAAPDVRELWLYAGKKDKLRFTASCEREVSASELADLGYPHGKGKPHSDRYLLFKVKPLEGDDVSRGGAEARRDGGASRPGEPHGRGRPPGGPRILVRLSDFKRSALKLAEIRKTLSEASAAEGAKPFSYLDFLPSDLISDWAHNLCVCEEALQLDFNDSFFRPAGDTASTICRSIGAPLNTPGWPDDFGRCLLNSFHAYGNREIRTLSLFSGAGGLDIGFSDAGFKIIESVEIEAQFCKTLELNSGNGRRFAGSRVNCIDIRKFSTSEIGKIDFVIGGPPCQTFSAAGRRANGVLGTTDSRGVLFREYVRILKELSPKGFLFENVYGITGAQNGEAWREIQTEFCNAGYHLFFRILDAADYGVPQHRERLIIVGLKTGEYRFPRPTHGPDSIDKMPFYDSGTAVSGVPLTAEEAKPGLGGRFGHLLPDIPPGLNYSFYTEKLGHPKPIFAWRSKFSDFLYKADPLAPVRTIKASGGAYTGPLHWGNRFFSVGEYKRLQTFPDDYAISGGKQIAVKQIGNSVPPQLARMLAIAIQQQVFHAVLPFRLATIEEGEALSFRKRKSDLTREFRGRAQKALSGAMQAKPSSLSEDSYECTLSPEFKFEKTDVGTGDFSVSYAPKVGISVRDVRSPKPMARSPSLLIKVSPADDGWVLGLDHMDIAVYSNKKIAFTVGWKAFEQLLSDHSIKADLVQLNGYYQYEPKLHCSCVFASPFPFKGIVSSVVSGQNVARIKSTEQLSAAWNVSPETVWDVADFLRSLGYEVRNPNTNPQIPPGHWLIPYAFPTFTQRSVQLRKKLR